MKEPIQTYSYGQLRQLLDDLFPVRPLHYWLDFSLTSVIGWLAFYLAVSTPWSAAGQKGACLALSAFAFFRALIFVHELAHVATHQQTNALPGFRPVWNALCGMLFFVPDYTYAPHAGHHLTATFSTKDDPEYLPMAHHRLLEHVIPFLMFPLVPLLLAARFLVLGPISLVVGGRFREWLLVNASTLKMNPAFQWKHITDFDRRRSFYQDLACVVWWAAFIGLFIWLGHRTFLLDWYLLVWAVFVINHIRSWARHRYTNLSGHRVTYEAQLVDSVAVVGFSPLAFVFMPVGLRYHSLHHMFQKLPYHSLGRAHKRLLEVLPADHLYRQTIVTGFLPAVANLFRSASHPQPSTTSPE